jgi:aminoglycoside phosphotransferase family enzyme
VPSPRLTPEEPGLRLEHCARTVLSPDGIECETGAAAAVLTSNAVSITDEVAFLSKTDAYPDAVREVARRETHMSWVFLVGETVYKLKKPVRFPYLDFSTLARREAACRAELILNRRLGPDVYKGMVALVSSPQGLAIGGPGEIVDWLVVMRRLDERQTLEYAIVAGPLATWQLDRLISTLVAFYRRAEAVFVSPENHLVNWRRSLAYNRQVLLNPQLHLPAGMLRQIDRVQRLFLAERSGLIADRVRQARIVDGHGDLRPEHIWLGDPVRIIDCLEFNPRLRAVDPFDEIAFLCVECERLGSRAAGRYIKQRVLQALADGLSEELFTFYRCHRATLRARLAIAHLLEPNPRAPEKWPALARAYLQLAKQDAVRLERMLRIQAAR